MAIAINWTAEFETGIDIIDEQHKRIFEYLKEIDEAISSKSVEQIEHVAFEAKGGREVGVFADFAFQAGRIQVEPVAPGGLQFQQRLLLAEPVGGQRDGGGHERDRHEDQCQAEGAAERHGRRRERGEMKGSAIVTGIARPRLVFRGKGRGGRLSGHQKKSPERCPGMR